MTQKHNGEVPKSRLRIMIADDSTEFTNTIIPILNEKFDVLGTVADGSSALELINHLQPDIAILDLEMPGLNGIELTKRLMQSGTPSRIIICSVHHDPDIIRAAIAAGALGYVAKAHFARDIVTAVEGVSLGKRFTSL